MRLNSGSGCRRCGIPVPVDERETHLVPNAVETPDFVDTNLIVFAQPPGHVDHARWDV
jgi:hypothetical protein